MERARSRTPDRSAAGNAESPRLLRGRPTASGIHRRSEPETARGSGNRRASELPREKERS